MLHYLNIIRASRRRFSPLDLGPALWLDASDANTLFDAVIGGGLVEPNGSIARWEDKSGNARHASQTNSTKRPLRVISAKNGKDAVSFDGLDDYMYTVAFGGNQTWTRFVVFNSLQTTDKVVIAHAYDYNSPLGADFIGIAFNSLQTAQNGGGGITKMTTKLSSAKLVPVNKWVFCSQNADGTINGHVPRVNGQIFTFTTPQNNNPGNFTKNPVAYGIGGYISGLYTFPGLISEVIHYPYALTNDQRQTVEKYISSKYAIETT